MEKGKEAMSLIGFSKKLKAFYKLLAIDMAKQDKWHLCKNWPCYLLRLGIDAILMVRFWKVHIGTYSHLFCFLTQVVHE